MLIAPNVRANQPPPPPPPPPPSSSAPPAEALEALAASLMAFSPFVGFARDERKPRRGAVTAERTERMPLLIADDGFGLLPLPVLPTGRRPVAGGVPETTLVAEDEAKLPETALLMPETALLIPLALLTLEAVEVVVDDLADAFVGLSTGAAAGAPATGASPCFCATAAGRAPLREESTPKPMGPMRRKGARLWRAEPTASWLDVGTAYDGPANEVLEHAVSRRALLVALRALVSYEASTTASAPGW